MFGVLDCGGAGRYFEFDSESKSWVKLMQSRSMSVPLSVFLFPKEVVGL